MARIREEDYAFAAARIRAIEPKLITRAKLDRLLDMTDPSDSVKLLMESGYGTDHMGNSKDRTENVELLLSLELKKAYDLLFEILPDKRAVTLFMRKYDYLNAKLILKGEFLGTDVSGSLSAMGTIEPEKLQKIIKDRALAELPEIFGNAVREAIETFNQTSDPQTVDFILDRATYENMASDAKETEEPYLIDLVKRLTDIANIRVSVRAKFLSLPADLLRRAFVKGGSISESSFEELSEKGLDGIFEALKNSDVSGLIKDLEHLIENKKGISEIEKVLDDYIIKDMRQSKYITFGIEPVIAYLFYKETEVKNVRLIITGQVNKISHEIIKERLRLGYA